MGKRKKPDAGEAPKTEWSDVYPDPLREAEEEMVAARREAALEGKPVKSIVDKWVSEKKWHKGPLDGPKIGVACSGGGIRSATFCLGFFQGLAKVRDRAAKDGSNPPRQLLNSTDLQYDRPAGHFRLFSAASNQNSLFRQEMFRIGERLLTEKDDALQ